MLEHATHGRNPFGAIRYTFKLVPIATKWHKTYTLVTTFDYQIKTKEYYKLLSKLFHSLWFRISLLQLINITKYSKVLFSICFCFVLWNAVRTHLDIISDYSAFFETFCSSLLYQLTRAYLCWKTTLKASHKPRVNNIRRHSWSASKNVQTRSRADCGPQLQ